MVRDEAKTKLPIYEPVDLWSFRPISALYEKNNPYEYQLHASGYFFRMP